MNDIHVARLGCTCGGTHFITVSLEDDPDPYLYLEGCWCWPGLGGYLRRIWHALRGTNFHEPEVLLNRDTTGELIERLMAVQHRLWQNPKPHSGGTVEPATALEQGEVIEHSTGASTW